MSNGLNGHILRIPVLGRNFTLGTLYDARNDIAVPGSNSVCSEDALGAFKTSCNESVDYSLIPSDKLSEKLDDVGVKGLLQISILAERIELQGSLQYLKKKRSEFHESSVHVRCHYRTATKEFTSGQLDEAKIRYLQVAPTGSTATHVITKIQYGAEATFTLTKGLDETEDEHEANSLLKACAKNLIAILRGRADDEECLDSITGTNVECRLEGDFLLPITFATYEEAKTFAKNFARVLSNAIKDAGVGNEPPLGTPCTAWLYPLVHGAENALQNETGDDVVLECVQQIENYDEAEAKLDYLLNDTLAKKLNPFHEKLRHFQRHLILFRTNHKTELKDMAVNLRSGLVKIDNLKQLVQRINNEQFAFNRLIRWLEEKFKELCTMRKYQEQIHQLTLSANVLLFPSAETLQEHMMKCPVNFGFELAFTSLAYPERFLELVTTRTLLDVLPSAEDGDRERWYENGEIVKRIEKEIIVIAKLIQSKRNDDKFAFAITAPNQHNELTLESSIIVHQQQKKSHGWNAIDIVCQHYPKLNLIDIVRLLSDADIADYWNHMNFLALCRFYDKANLIDLIRLFLERGVDLINCKTDDGWNALLLVCRYYTKENLLEIARLLLARGVDVNCKTNGGLNALHLVCRYYEKENLFDIARLFFERGIDVNCQFEDGWNALLFFCRNYQRDNLLGIIRLFLAQKVDVNYQTKGGNNALHFLCRYYDRRNLIEIIRLLLERGIDVNSKNSEGWNALYLVCRYYERDNLIEIVRLFLKRGIDVNCKNSEGWNSLHLVCRYYKRDNLIKIIRLLLDKNIEINCKTNSGCNVLHNVCRYYSNDHLIEIVQLLLDNGIFASFTNNEGWNALLNVCRYYPNDNLIDLVQLFLEEGIDVNWANNEGWNALHLVCRYYKQDNVIDIVQLLLDYNIDVNGKTNNGCNALHFACGRYYQNDNLIETVELLLDSGISVNCKNNDGWNGLHNVCRYQRKKNMLELIPLLIRHKISINAVTTGGKTARSILLGRYKEESVKEILNILDLNASQC
ncbi:LOW QUALITY PROTEIN: uncharacterized protein LOC116930355 [Daphnia magna]|uniref:LOW QUALITY PROTEIN: uncharacterized protein LOC116930355 n=1 Tax=Daphnia magna TaxID=35525 RepID=UPI001E1BAAF3|nr:LOW QUALITY PROTEIN: uncharacterized protein LOC116930355 [Daphnia magna]